MRDSMFRLPGTAVNRKAMAGWRSEQSECRWSNSSRILLIGLAFVFSLLGSVISLRATNVPSLRIPQQTTQNTVQQSKTVRPELLKTYGKLPISFEANRGQTFRSIKFLSRGPGYTLFLTSGEAILSLEKTRKHSKRDGQPRGDQLTGSVFSIFARPSLFSAFGQSTPRRTSEKDSETIRSTGKVESQNREVLRLKLAGANPHTKATGLNELPGKSNYFIGNNPQEWLTNIPNYAEVQYQDIYPGVNLVYYGNPHSGGRLEYDFVVAPGADLGSIKLSIEGADHLSLDARGNLLITVPGGRVRLNKPVVYQQNTETTFPAKKTAPARHFLRGWYQLDANGQVSFKVEAYDASKPLVIDPVLSYSTYLGGAGIDVGTRVAVDSSGDAYITGLTSSTDFPNTPGTVDQTIGAQACGSKLSGKTFPCPDAFVTELSPDGKTILYSTFLGGSMADGATGITVDSSGNVFLTGFTNSSDFPTTSGAFQTVRRGQSDIFVSKLNSTGSALLYSTLIGGAKDDIPMGIAGDSSGNAYIGGITFSTDFPATNGSFQSAIKNGACVKSVAYGYTYTCPDAFVAKLNNTGTSLAFATYLGGSNADGATSIAVDSTGAAYVTGVTESTDFPTTSGSYEGTSSGGTCGPSSASHPCTQSFVTKLNPTGTGLSYSTYFGGNGDTMGTGVAVDATNNSYIAGLTNATNFPTTGQSFAMGTCGNTTNSFDCPDAFVAKFNSGGTALSYMTYLGGTSYDLATDIRLDGAGDAYVVGATDSLDFPATTSAVQQDFGGGSCSATIDGLPYTFDCPNAFLAVLNTTGSSLFSTFLGGAGGSIALGVAVDSSGNALLAGTTISADFPVANAEQGNLAGDTDAFVAKISGLSTSAAAVSLSPTTLSFGSVSVGSSSGAQIVTLSNSGSSSVSITGITVTGTDSGDFSQTSNCGTSVAASSSCTISVTFTPSASGSRSATLSVADNAPNSPQTASLSGQGQQDFSLTATTTSQTITAGGTASYDLTLAPKGGFNQAVNLSCAGAPAHSSCAVQPTSVTLDGTNSAPVKLTVSTTAASVTGPGDPGNFGPPSGFLPLAAWLVLFAMLAMIAVAKINRKSPGLRTGSFVMLALLITFWVACGGGNSPPPSTSNSTPTGTYTLTVTGTSGTLSNSTQVTLKVQ